MRTLFATLKISRPSGEDQSAGICPLSWLSLSWQMCSEGRPDRLGSVPVILLLPCAACAGLLGRVCGGACDDVR